MLVYKFFSKKATFVYVIEHDKSLNAAIEEDIGNMVRV